MDIKIYLDQKREFIDSYLKSYLDAPSSPAVLHEAMQYSLMAGGKRIRPILAMASYEACGGDAKTIIPQAAALELIHTYSLIHDDLPAMDDDDLRRGKPTSHKVFGEAMAILAGDALLTEAFLMITETNSPLPPFTKVGNKNIEPPFTKVKNKNIKPPFYKGGVGGFSGERIKPSSLLKAVREIALAGGAYGMVGGQAQDILSENEEPDRDTLDFIHTHKTAALIAASVRIGPILANSRKKQLHALTKYGENIGLTFQIIDDILDVEGTTEELGKSAGSDRKKKKMTYPSLFGIDGARKKATDLVKEAIDALKIFSSEADPLREIAGYLRERKA
jgi:geranylgeranyl diphosphate synthase type II